MVDHEITRKSHRTLPLVKCSPIVARDLIPANRQQAPLAYTCQEKCFPSIFLSSRNFFSFQELFVVFGWSLWQGQKAFAAAREEREQEVLLDLIISQS